MISKFNSKVFSISKLTISLLVFASLVLAACQPAAAPTAEAPTIAPPTTVPQPTVAPPTSTVPAPEVTESPVPPTEQSLTEATINVAVDPKYGPILVDGKGMTLYMFTKDEADKSNCAGECLVKWPPLITQGEPTLGEGVDAAMVGSTALEDGSNIVTYNHMPLYYWWKDLKSGDTDGQAVGEVWYVINPAGEIIKAEIASSAASASASSASSEAAINIANDPVLGPILVDGEGMTLYMFTKDDPDKSNCTGDCLVKWPPFLTQGNPTLVDGVDPALVGFSELSDGSKIVTYNHMPLYYWWEDLKPGETLGQGVGEVWYVVAPDGTVIMPQASAQSAPVLNPTPTKKPKPENYSSGY